ncbi:MAG: Mu transposase C-terminal domain-containing protein [Flavobacteriales bacterium]|jgi:hypothetical protein|nr:Mu transposase C-terminal domain-containing protein [Flavobacteriales bacterium]
MNNYRNLIRRKWLQVIRRGGNGRTALVSYDSIPERFKKVIVDKFGDPRETTKQSRIKDKLVTDLKAAEYFNNYTLDNGSALPEKAKKEYLANACVLNALHKVINETKSVRGKVKNAWIESSDAIQKLPKHTYPHTLPKNVQSLKRKHKKYIAEGYESLIHKGFCNDNSEKITEDAKVWVISRWADRVAVCANMEQLLFEYNQLAIQKGWKTLKEEKTLYNYLNKEGVKHLWYGHRHGDAVSKEKFVYQHSTILPTMRDSLWYSDGTKLNYFYLDKDGKVATCQVYEIMDAYSEVLLGYHISKSEDYVTQYHAYKMAVQISGHRPYQLGFDGQGGHKKLKSGNFLTKLSRLAIRTQPYNGKSKTIENAFFRFQSQFLKRDWFFTGQNITAKRQESKMNREFINANKANLPTFEEVVEIYKKRRQEWNEALHPKTRVPRLEMYNQSTNPNTSAINLWDMVDLFWVEREKPVICTAYGISFTEKKQKHTYVVYREDSLPDVEWLRNNVDKKFHIKYDPEDMSMVYLYENTPLGLRFVSEARIKVEIHRGKQEQESWEAEYYKKVEELKKQSRLAADEKMDSLLESEGRAAHQYGLNSPSLLGLKNKREKVANNIGKIQKEESNYIYIEEEDKTDNSFNHFDKY